MKHWLCGKRRKKKTWKSGRKCCRKKKNMENKWEIQVKDVYNSWTSINFDVNQFILSMALFIMFVLLLFLNHLETHEKYIKLSFFMFLYFPHNVCYFMHCGKLLHFLNILTCFFLFVVINVWCFFFPMCLLSFSSVFLWKICLLVSI